MPDIKSNRDAKNYSAREFAYRMAGAWDTVCLVSFLVLCLSFAPCGCEPSEQGLEGTFAFTRVRESTFPGIWRSGTGLRLANGRSSMILGKVTIGNKVTISQRAHLCAGSHDYQRSCHAVA